MLDVTLPAEEEVELVVEYGGFPQQNRILSTMQGSLEISREYLCLENATLAPRLLNVTSDSGQIPVTVEITLPDHMTVIPFGTAEAEIVEKHDDGTAPHGATKTREAAAEVPEFSMPAIISAAI